MTLWAEGFRKQYPNVKIQIEGKGSSTAPPALIAGTAQLGPMSRHDEGRRDRRVREEVRLQADAVRVAVDALAVYVNKDNPIKGLTMPQVDAIFSKTRKGGTRQTSTTWGQLGLTGDWADRPISLYGRNSASGTYGFFKEHALDNGDYKDTVKEQPGSASVVQGVAEDRSRSATAASATRRPGVRAVPLARPPAARSWQATYEKLLHGNYPLARFLYIYVNKAPKPLDPMPREFLKFVLSRTARRSWSRTATSRCRPRLVEQELARITGATGTQQQVPDLHRASPYEAAPRCESAVHDRTIP